ncbi:DUF305 domain-containing protein [Actinosynnema sp. NPDC002837]
MTRKNLVGTALALLTPVLVLAGCGSDSTGHDPGSTTGHPSAAAGAPSGGHNEADVTFAQGMIPHHQGAIEMAKLVHGRTTTPEVLDLASRIEKAQDPEIKTMTGWLTGWGAQVHTTGMPGMDHGSDQPGMGAAEMEALAQARDTEFDRMFLGMMIRHHQGAIEMANVELRHGANAEAKALAQRIVDAQQAEITEMQGLLPPG